jgi:hypothetical protein
MVPHDETDGMDALAQTVSDATDQALAAQEAALLALTRTDLEALRPRIPPEDLATFEQLVRTLAEATAQNESIAQIQERVARLGEGAVRLVSTLSRWV